MTPPRSAYDLLLQRIQELVVQRVGELEDPDVVKSIIETEIEKFQREPILGGVRYEVFVRPEEVAKRLGQDLGGYSVLAEVLQIDDLEEVYGSGVNLTWRTTSGATRAVTTPANPYAVLALLQRYVAAAGTNMDSTKPGADGIRVTLPNGRAGRLTVSIPPRIAKELVVSFTLRVPQKRNTTLDDLVAWDSMSQPAADFLTVLMWAKRVKILVAGPPGAGKTTVLEALLRAVPATRKVNVLQENDELTAPLVKGEYWLTSGVETLDALLHAARTASPDLIVLGEMKGGEARNLAVAANFGTAVVVAVHSDSAPLAFDALATAANIAAPSMTHAALVAEFARLVDVVVYVDSDEDPSDGGQGTLRQVTSISVVPPQMGSSEVSLYQLFGRDDIGGEMKYNPLDVGKVLRDKCDRVLRPRGRTLLDVLEGRGLGRPR